MSSALAVSKVIIFAGVSAGFCESTSPAAPATCAAAIDVPAILTPQSEAAVPAAQAAVPLYGCVVYAFSIQCTWSLSGAGDGSPPGATIVMPGPELE